MVKFLCFKFKPMRETILYTYKFVINVIYSKNSIVLPSGSATMICFPPGPSIGPLQILPKWASMRAFWSSHWVIGSTILVSPPGTGRVPSSHGFAAEVFGPLNHNSKSPLATIAKADPHWSLSSKPRALT